MRKRTLGIVGLIIIVTITLVSGIYYIGFNAGLEQTKRIVIENVSNTTSPEVNSANFAVFWEVWDKLKNDYLNGGDLSNQDLIYGATKGLTEATGDPHTTFFNPEDSKKFNDDVRGVFAGIGAEIGIRDKQIIIVAPLKGTPAELAGVKPGDKIRKIDGESTQGMSIDEAVKKIRGKIGTKVVLTIFRDDWDKEKDIEIIRADIRVPTVRWKIKDGNIIYLQLFSFNGNTDTVFKNAIIQSVLSGGKGIVLDLRGNPGGYLDVAVDIAGWFIKRGDVVVMERFSSGDKTILRANGNEALRGFPVVILIDKGSASASEILAGALRVQNGIKLVGEQSFGKGTVQELQRLSDGSSLKVTVANWLLPDGSIIEGNGLTPDVKVPISENDITAGKDPQLEKAIEVLKQEMK